MNTTLPGTNIRLEDIYFVLFRRKWLILSFLALALLGVAVVWKAYPPVYTSRASILVRYVVETGGMKPPGSDERIQQVMVRGGSPLNTEMELISSGDLAREVAKTLGPERLLLGGAPGNEEAALGEAVRVVRQGLSVGSSGQAPVISVRFSHWNRGVPQELLESLLQQYLALHTKIHLSGATYDALAKEADERKLRLRQTEEQLQQLRSEMGGTSLEDAQRAVATEIETLRKSILAAEAELVEAEAIQADLPGGGEVTAGTPSEPILESPDVTDETSTTNEASASSPTEADVYMYQVLLKRLAELRTREQEYLGRFTEENPMVRNVQNQIAGTETRRQQMLATHPGLEVTTRPYVDGSVSATRDSGLPRRVSIVGLKARLSVLRSQLEKARAESLRLSDLERRMADIQLSQQIQEEGLRYLATRLEEERYEGALDATKNSNINILERPSQPVSTRVGMLKTAGAVFGGFAAAGLVLAFLIELFLDPRVKHATQLETVLKTQVYVSIPRSDRRVRGKKQALVNYKRKALPEGGEAPKTASTVEPELKPLNGMAKAYAEALRDRLIVYFDRVNLRRKPKLVGVTSCHGDAGVSSIAEGLASALSETGGGKVLLVDIAHGRDGVQSYQMGEPVGELQHMLDRADEPEQLTEGKRVYRASYDRRNGDYHPTRSPDFDALIPKLKASDFDYIVFDMPPLTPTSTSFRVAGFLDKTLVVAEAERTHLAPFKQALTMLEESNARVSLVVNKARSYLPKWLQPPE